MKTLLSLAASASLIVGLAAGSLADPKQPKKATKPPECPVCHMALSATKTDKNPTAVKIKGKTYYCCAACKMPAKKPAKKP